MRTSQCQTHAAPSVSVIVCGRDGAKYSPTLWDALGRQTLERERFELIYVDDCSTDRSVELARAAGIARVIPCTERVGLPRARNIGVAAGRAPVLAFTDVDTVPDAGWLQAGLERFRSGDVDLLAGGITITTGPRPSLAALVDATTFLDQHTYVRFGYAAGANMWVTRRAYDAVGGFPDGLEAYGGDDEEFGKRITGSGHGIVYAPEVHLTHPSRTRASEVARKAYRIGYSRAARRRIEGSPLNGTAPSYHNPRALLPGKRLRGLHRIGDLEYTPTVPELVGMHVARWGLVQVPMVAGDVVGEWRAMRARSRT